MADDHSIYENVKLKNWLDKWDQNTLLDSLGEADAAACDHAKKLIHAGYSLTKNNADLFWEKFRADKQDKNVCACKYDRTIVTRKLLNSLAAAGKVGDPTVAHTQRKMFDWFLRRYDPGSAMRMLLLPTRVDSESCAAGFLSWFGLVSFVLLLIATLIGLGSMNSLFPQLQITQLGRNLAFAAIALAYLWPALMIAFFSYITKKTDRVTTLEAIYLVIQAWLPRLLVVVIAGMLISLTTESYLLKATQSSSFPLTVSVFVATVLYLLFEMLHRLRPFPVLRLTAQRLLHIVCIGLTHALVALLLLLRLNSSLHDSVLMADCPLIVATNLVFIFFSIGIFANIILGDQRITQQL